MHFSEVSLSESVEFARLKAAGNTKQKKKCTKGWSCGYTCLPRTKKNCDNGIEGDAKTLTEWLEKNSGGSKSKVNKIGDLSKKDLQNALSEKFGVKSVKELAKNKMFALSNGGKQISAKDLQDVEKLADQYRKNVGIIPNDPVNQPGEKGVVNGINIFKYSMPWKAFDLDPKSATTADIKSAYRKLSRVYHPDNPETGDAEVFDRLNVFYRSLTAKF